MRTALCMAILVALAGSHLQGQDITGNWQGTLKTADKELRLVLHIGRGANGAIKATLDSPDQGANDIPASFVAVLASALTLKVDAVKGDYQGTVSADGNVITGSWSQGQPLPLVFRRMASGAAPPSASYDDLLARAKSAMAAKDYPAAVTACRQAIGIDERRWEAYAIGANGLTGQRQHDEAITMLQSALARAPEEHKPLIRDAIGQVRSQVAANPAPVVSTDRQAKDIAEAKRLMSAKQGTAARDLLAKWAAAGDAEAMANMGIVYYAVQGIPQDLTLAKQWFEKAAAAGNALGMHYLGVLSWRKDYVQSRLWHEKAAAGGIALSMHSVGLIYEQGHGVPVDYGQAREWYAKAYAASSLAYSALRLGMIFEQGGPGLSRDLAEARRWYEKAAAGGNSLAKERLSKLGTNKD